MATSSQGLDELDDTLLSFGGEGDVGDLATSSGQGNRGWEASQTDEHIYIYICSVGPGPIHTYM